MKLSKKKPDCPMAIDRIDAAKMLVGKILEEFADNHEEAYRQLCALHDIIGNDKDVSDEEYDAITNVINNAIDTLNNTINHENRQIKESNERTRIQNNLGELKHPTTAVFNDPGVFTMMTDNLLEFNATYIANMYRTFRLPVLVYIVNGSYMTVQVDNITYDDIVTVRNSSEVTFALFTDGVRVATIK